jgi:hypothetical protein
MKFLAQLPGVPISGASAFNTPFGTTKTLADLVSLVVRIGFVVSGLLVLFFIVFAGFQIITSAGGNNPEGAKKGQQAASAAVIGFVVVFAAYWIVRLIEFIIRINIIS